jgi:hypothetical protein
MSSDRGLVTALSPPVIAVSELAANLQTRAERVIHFRPIRAQHVFLLF